MFNLKRSIPTTFISLILAIGLFVIAPVLALAQGVTFPEGPNVNPTGGPPMVAYSKLFFRDGSGNTQFVCIAKSRNRLTTLSVTGATNASPIVITTSGNHGLATDNTVTISGVLGNTAANGTFTITVVSATTFQLNSTTGNGAYTSGGSASTSAPRSNDSIWAVEKFYYTGTNIDRLAWANGTSAMTSACDDRANVGVGGSTISLFE